MAARSLHDAGHEVLVIDKGRGVGGRMATRRITTPDGTTAVFDHGAQFFTVRDEEMARLVTQWTNTGVVREWCRGFAGDDGHPRYVVNGGMAALAKHLSSGLAVRTSTLVFAVRPGDKGHRWTVVIDDASTIECDAVIVTCPLPQSYSLTITTGLELPRELLTTDYDRTIALLAVVDRPDVIPAPGGLQNPDHVFSWIGDNVAKGVSSVPAITFHANPAWSLEHWEDSRDDGLAAITTQAQRWLGDAHIVACDYKKWRFATPQKVWPDRCYGNDGIVFAGDAFSGPKVESAVLSGIAAARRVLDSAH